MKSVPVVDATADDDVGVSWPPRDAATRAAAAATLCKEDTDTQRYAVEFYMRC